MSSINVLDCLPSDHFHCIICTKIFTDPVTTPCGHSFCKSCLNHQWDQSEFCQCPVCKKRFAIRPEIGTNSVMEELSVQIKQRRLEISELAKGLQHVDCDVCMETALRAVKSCLVCQASYCALHLEPHLRVPGLARHKLIEPVENIEERVCPRHNKALDFFCREDGIFVCVLCLQTDHKDHQVVSMEEEGAQQKENMGSLMRQIELMIEERMDKVKTFTNSSVMRKETAQKEIQNMDAVMNIFTRGLQKAQTKFRTTVQEKLQTYRDRDERVVAELQQEVKTLQRTHSELQELSTCDDIMHLLPALRSLNSRSEVKDWTETEVFSEVCVETVRLAVAKLLHKFQSILKILTEEEMIKIKKYKENLTFDPNTAGRHLHVYNFDQSIKHHKIPTQSVSLSANRFQLPMVFTTKGFSRGRHYWEVQVCLRSDWDVGVAKEGVSRGSEILVKPVNGFYAITKEGLTYTADSSSLKALHLAPRPHVIGVFLDYEDGRLSFYDVDRKIHIHSFVGEKFTEKLFPYFYLYSKAKKSKPMVLRTVAYSGGGVENGVIKMEEEVGVITCESGRQAVTEQYETNRETVKS